MKKEGIPLPLKEEDLKKIPRLGKFSPEEFEDFVIKITNNLDKIPLDILEVLVPEIIEVIGPPSKLPPRTALNLVGYVRIIVEREAKLHSAKTELEEELEVKHASKKGLKDKAVPFSERELGIWSYVILGILFLAAAYFLKWDIIAVGIGVVLLIGAWIFCFWIMGWSFWKVVAIILFLLFLLSKIL